jgi:drug/metabolite transporter (DMT)-like permease
MHFVLLTIFCSTSIALILKFSDVRKGDPIVLLAANYLVASVISFISLLLYKNPSFTYQTFFFGMFLGLLFVLSFFVFAKAIGLAGTGLATTSSRLSVVIPIILSIIIYSETPNEYHLLGIILTFITFILFYLSIKGNRKKGEGVRKYLILILVFIGIGFNDFAMKIFKNWRMVDEEPYFVFFIFTFALLFSSIYILVKKIKLKKSTFITGLIMGVPNVFSTIFLLAALTILPGIIVYPLMNVGVIVATTLLAYIFWKERPDKFGITGLIVGIIAIVLLSIK